MDLRRERALAPRGRRVILSRALPTAMARPSRRRGQCILFLNRRGFSTQIMCFDCGFGVSAARTATSRSSTTPPKTACAATTATSRSPPPEICSSCGAPDTALLGVGTESLEEEVRSHFPEARIARLDRDTAAGRGTHGPGDPPRVCVLGELDVLVGTQMVAKGHDFPGVRLVGVVNADLGLHLPDFRAAERTFQLLTQVAGRAGRDGSAGAW